MVAPVDILNQQFGLLTVLERVGSSNNGRSMWRCRCECGAEAIVSANNLRKGGTRSCGCLSSRAFVDLTGIKFGMLTVLAYEGISTKKQHTWRCRCECGAERVVSRYFLKSGLITHCGCLDPHAFVDITESRFNRWVVIEYAGIKDHQRLWKCRCDCGEVRVVPYTSLSNGKSKSCGCLRIDQLPRLPAGEAARNALLNQYKHDAKRRSISFSLESEEFFALTQGCCFYCGRAPSQTLTLYGGRGTCVYSGVDRIDNTRGYISGNVVSCCWDCNNAKGVRTQQEFLEWIDRVHAYIPR